MATPVSGFFLIQSLPRSLHNLKRCNRFAKKTKFEKMVPDWHSTASQRIPALNFDSENLLSHVIHRESVMRINLMTPVVIICQLQVNFVPGTYFL
jgi:hypothetical protein